MATHLAIETPDSPESDGWRDTITKNFSLTLLPLGTQVKRVNVRLLQSRPHGMTSIFVGDLRVSTAQGRIAVRTQHADADLAIAMAFSRARRDILRNLGRRYAPQ